MPRPAKTLQQLVLDGTFRARRHHELLAGPVVEWPQLAVLQARYATTDHPLDRRAIGIEFEHAVHELDVDENELAERERAEGELRELLDAEPEEVDLDALGAELDRSSMATWYRDLRRSGSATPRSAGRSAPTARRSGGSFCGSTASSPLVE